MRLVTHNTLRNNAADAKGGGYPLRITATQTVVDDSSDNIGSFSDREIAFVKGILGILDWDTLLAASSSIGLSTLPPALTEELAQDDEFLAALYHILMNVHVTEGTLTCPTTKREFKISNGIVDFMLEEDESENVRA